MYSRSLFKLGLTALAVGGAIAGGISTHGLVRAATAAAGPGAGKAASEARAAEKALARRKADQAVPHAERAVANDPANARYRALLGQAYLLAGRFTSARQALEEALALDPDHAGAALNLALARIAQGDWAGARATLQANGARIPASDRGLALALAGDPVSAIDLLGPAAREAGATAKTRQNLALALALAGRWNEASGVAAMDVAPDKLQARLMEWAAFARPTNAYDQVASLLGVRPVEDPGQPLALALARQPDYALAAVEPAVPVAAMAAPAPEAAEPMPAVAQQADAAPGVIFAPRAEIIQPIARPLRVAAAPRPAPAPAAAAPAPASRSAPRLAAGSYYVQLGAYENAAVARDAWGRYAHRVPALSAIAPRGSGFTKDGTTFYRLSVGGFARADAAALCRQVKARGGTCFVRAEAGDALAAWTRRGAEFAAR